MKCLILGGGGFLGSHLADALLAHGEDVRLFERPAFSRHNIAHLDDQVELQEGSLENPSDLDRALADVNVVFHLACATVPSTSNEDPAFDLATNVLPTLRVLDRLRNLPGSRVVFFSSGGTVYGIPEYTPIPESHPTNPISAYGVHKLTIEKYLFLFHQLHGVDARVLRISNAFGERQSPTSGQGAIAAFLYRALRGEIIEIWGDGSVVRDYIYVSDVIRAAMKMMVYEGEVRVINIGSGVGRSVNEVIKTIEDTVGRRAEVRYSSGRSLDVRSNILDTSRAMAHLNWVPEVGFEDGVRRTLDGIMKLVSLRPSDPGGPAERN
jgi:UDP-glucose 4-epimerase